MNPFYPALNSGKISEISSVINIPYHISHSRKSTFDIPSTSFQNTDYTTNVPKPLYTNLENDQPSPLTSSTFSDITKNIQNKLNIFENVLSLLKDILLMISIVTITLKRNLSFSKKILKQRLEIKNYFYDFVALHKIQFLFFD
jgi:hypothetical protein